MKRILIFLLAAALLSAVSACSAAKTPDNPPAAAPTPGSGVSLTIRRNAETVFSRAVTDPEEIQTLRDIAALSLMISAAWEGVEVSELEDYIAFTTLDDPEPQTTYYQFDTDGRHVLQTGETGYYTIMTDSSYDALLKIAGLSPDGAISVEAATALLQAQFGEKDAATGNPFSFVYRGTETTDGRDWYRFGVSWLVDGSHLSHITDYLVATDGSALLEAPQ